MTDTDARGHENHEEDEGETEEPALGGSTNQALNSRRLDHFVERSRYAYLFHMWAEPRRGGKQPLWRFSLEEVETGVRHGFGNLNALLDFLQQRMATE